MAATRLNSAPKTPQETWQAFLDHSQKMFCDDKGDEKYSEYSYFLGKAVVADCNDQNAIALLSKQLESGSWETIDFCNPKLQPVVLKLFATKQIIPQQAYTLLRLMQLPSFLKKHNTTKVHIHRVLDDKGQFTQDALNYLIAGLNKGLYSFNQANGKLDALRSLVAALPLSEQYFFTFEIDIPKLSSLTTTLLLSGAGSSLVTNTKLLYIHPTCALEDAIGITQIGLERHTRSIPRLGKFTMDDIEFGVRRRFRPQAIAYQGIASFESVHDYKDVVDEEASGHDKHHANVLSSLSENIHHAMMQMVDITRAQLNVKWTREIWDWIDCDFRFFCNRESMAIEFKSDQTTQKFCHFLLRGNQSQNKEHSRGGYLIHYQEFSSKMPFPTPAGIMIFMDMLTNPQNWLRYQINPEQLIEPFKYFYDGMKKILPSLAKKPAAEVIFKCQLYFALLEIKRTNCFNLICEALKDIPFEIIIKKLTAKDAGKYSLLHPANVLALHINGQKIIAYNSLLAQINAILIKAKKPFLAQAIFIEQLTTDDIPKYITHREHKATHEEAMYAVKPNGLSFFDKLPFYVGIKSAKTLPADEKQVKPAAAKPFTLPKSLGAR